MNAGAAVEGHPLDVLGGVEDDGHPLDVRILDVRILDVRILDGQGGAVLAALLFLDGLSLVDVVEPIVDLGQARQARKR